MRRLLNWGLFALVVLGAFILMRSMSVVIVDGRSMEPTYHHDDVVLAYERDSYDIGDVIVYDARVSGRFDVVHRVVGRNTDGFVTQGDNVPEPDYWTAEHEHIRGSVFLHIPRGGVALQWLRQPLVIFSLLMGWAAFEFMKAREKARKDEQEREDERQLEGVS